MIGEFTENASLPPDEHMFLKERSKFIGTIVSELDSDFKEFVRLHYYEGLTPLEISEVTNKDIKYIRREHLKVLRRLRRHNARMYCAYISGSIDRGPDIEELRKRHYKKRDQDCTLCEHADTKDNTVFCDWYKTALLRFDFYKHCRIFTKKAICW